MSADTEIPKKRAPALYAIAAFKLGKGVLLLLLALGVYTLADNDLLHDYRSILKWLHVDPERKFFSDLAAQIKTITPANILWVASGTAFYSLFSLAEGIGLSLRFSWAGYLAIAEGTFFIPIEIYELMHRFSLGVFVILVLNTAIVWYLWVNRHRVFRQHHENHPAPTAEQIRDDQDGVE